jgi:hypothetical protein
VKVLGAQASSPACLTYTNLDSERAGEDACAPSFDSYRIQFPRARFARTRNKKI